MEEKWIKMADLYAKVNDPMIHQFFQNCKAFGDGPASECHWLFPMFF